MTFVAVHDDQAGIRLIRWYCLWEEDFFEPLEADFVVRPAIWSCDYMPFWCDSLYFVSKPLSLKIFAFKNDAWVE